MFAYCFNNPINKEDTTGNWPKWVKKAVAAVAVVAVVAVVAAVTVATAGVTSVAACVAVGALKGAAIGAATGAVSGAVTSAVKHRATTGSWKGSGTVARDGAASGALSGAITGAITGGIHNKVKGICFVAGTSVLTSVGYVLIEDISVGDMVWSENPETGEKELKEVVQTFVNETDELVHVHVNGEEILTTPEHPFYVPKKGWIGAIDLRAGDILVLQSGEYVVVELIQHEILETPVTVYNFEVEDFHTYYVSDSAILVHNTCGAKSASNQVIKNDIINLPRTDSALKNDAHHAFSNIVDNYAGYATKSSISNGTLYQLPGSLNGVAGRFEWIVQDNSVTHRMFIKGGTINGIPIMP